MFFVRLHLQRIGISGMPIAFSSDIGRVSAVSYAESSLGPCKPRASVQGLIPRDIGWHHVCRR